MATDIFEHDGMVDFALDGGEVESSEELYSGNRVSKEGFYHLNATSFEYHKFDPDKKKLPAIDIDLMVLNGSDANGNELSDQRDRVISHRIYLAGWEDKENGVTKPLNDQAQKGIRALAYAFGLISDEDLTKKGIKVPFHMIEGRQAVAKVERDKDWTDNNGQARKGNLKILWNSNFWPVGHERVKDVHKDREALALLVGMGTGAEAGSDSDLSDI